ncbi:EamA family transporter [Nonomuraea mangrovi]|uniref:EamA family transporter n=1 Tax=Nonomuraea mangrovi TaxID=2316207 RepID=A0ABW4T789_9ACTN
MKNVLVAAVLWGTAGTAGLLITADPISVAAARLVFGGLVLAFMVRGVRITPALLLGAVAVAAYQLCFFAAVSRTGVAIGTVVAIGSGPVFTGLLSRQFSARWAAATAAAIAGCAALIAGSGARAGDQVVEGVLLALLGGLIYAFYAVTAARAINAGAPSDGVMGVMFGGAAAVMLPILIATGPGWLAEPRSLLAALYLGLGTTALAYFLYGRGLRTTPVSTAATLALAEPAVAALLGLVVLHETLSPVSWGGLVLLGVSLVAVAVPARKPTREGRPVSEGEPISAEAGVDGQRAR